MRSEYNENNNHFIINNVKLCREIVEKICNNNWVDVDNSFRRITEKDNEAMNTLIFNEIEDLIKINSKCPICRIEYFGDDKTCSNKECLRKYISMK